MTLFDILALVVVMTTLALVPSTSVALVVIRSSTAGCANGVAVAAGIVLGDLLFVGLALLGMSALAEAMVGFFLIMKYIAAAYLLWFGVNLLISNVSTKVEMETHAGTTLAASFISGLLVTLGDVKAIFFYASLLPMFVDMASVTIRDIAAIIVITLVTVGGVKLTYVYSARKVTALAHDSRWERRARTTAGGLMVGAGTYLIVKG